MIRNFIFSSTAAVYGSPDHSIPIKEDAPKQPISPYGASKLAAETEVDKFLSSSGNNGTSLRFFNVVGTAAKELMDNSTGNLVPIVMNKLELNQSPAIFGTDYLTSDGTCIRDYVDVRDIAMAHLLAADSKTMLPRAINVGTGFGISVREVINLICSTAKRPSMTILEKERRIGDPASLCADVSLMKGYLGFESKHSLSDSIQSLFKLIPDSNVL
jgi:UDP-glucose 4-epimerase